MNDTHRRKRNILRRIKERRKTNENNRNGKAGIKIKAKVEKRKETVMSIMCMND